MEYEIDYPQGEVLPQGDLEALRQYYAARLAKTAINTFDDNPCIVRGEE